MNIDAIESFDDIISTDIDGYKISLYTVIPYRALSIEFGDLSLQIDEKSRCVTVKDIFIIDDKEISYEITWDDDRVIDILITVLYKMNNYARITYELSNIDSYRPERSEMDSIILDCVDRSKKCKHVGIQEITWLNDYDQIYRDLYNIILRN